MDCSAKVLIESNIDFKGRVGIDVEKHFLSYLLK